ncbi:MULTISPECIES: hypothetical protein [unclassified Curtobacterium]|uniref:hypothetical protein n=1 Tax=unclassified Curtobacterium TaxID=257496 RepID=UPI0021AD25A4|nr:MULTISPECIES: hypothetical protein [unclassified Curtobacterium]
MSAIVIGVSSGFWRRLIEWWDPKSLLTDQIVLLPTLLIVAAIAGSREVRVARSPLALKLMLCAGVLGAINPLGAGLASNFLTGALLLSFVAAFLLGRTRSVNLTTVIRSVLLIATLNSVYMLAQVLWGLRPWDERWVRYDGYASLYVGVNEVRPLGLASSAAESALLAALGFVLAASCLILGLTRWRGLVAVVAAVCLVATVASGTRTFLILALVSVAFAVAVRGRYFLVRLLVALSVVAVGAVTFSRDLVGVAGGGAAHSLALISGSDQVSDTTAPVHVQLLVSGLMNGLRSIIGTGFGQLGQLTGNSANAEVDIANISLAAGILGVVALIAVYGRALVAAVTAMRGRDRLRLLLALCLVASIGQWLTVGFYGMTACLWLFMGALTDQGMKAGNDGTDLVDRGQGHLERDERGPKLLRPRPLRGGAREWPRPAIAPRRARPHQA